MKLELVDGRNHAAQMDDLIQMVLFEIRNSDSTHRAVAEQCLRRQKAFLTSEIKGRRDEERIHKQ